MTFRFIGAHRTRRAVERMARFLEGSPSGYYAWKRREHSRKSLSDRIVVKGKRDIQKRHKRRYDSPRIHTGLVARGLKAGRNCVARPMRLNDQSCLPPKQYQVTTDSRHHEPVAENILDCKFEVAESNTFWVSGITYIPNLDGLLYLCVVIDLFDRMVVGWLMRTAMTAAIVVDAFAMATFRRKPKDPLVFHSDRGMQYCCKAF